MRLSHATLPAGRLIGAAAPERTGIVHLGLGNFHRAHAAVYTAQALAAEPGDWGIVGVANRSRRVVDALRAQENLYSVLELSPAGERADVVDVHRRTLVAADDADEVVATLADPAHRIVTLTVSENGYHRSARTGDLDLDAAEIRADLADPANPRTTVGLLARGLERRAAAGGAPLTILSCDNLQSAGTTTRNMVEQFLAAAAAPQEVLDWVAASVTFPNAMVDRIVPGATDETREGVRRLLGVDDAAPVPAEAFTMWVIEDHFAAGRPRWEAAGAIFSDEVEAYELVKLRLLNGSHSLIAYLGALDGRETIPASRGQDFVEEAVRAAIADEYLPSIALPTGFDADDYVASLFTRWSNHSLGDRTSRVGSDGSTKLLQRVPEPALRLLHQGEVPQQMALTVAAWICCVVPPAGFVPGPVADAMQEPARARLAQATAGAPDVRGHVGAVLHGGFFPDELTAHPEFVSRVADLVEVIVTHGVRAATREALSARPTVRS
ncbi:mannitol dehydrogenase family protein [Georgenia ruanii]|uniref:Mannitol-1-phosphate 5-dehydrogenase n=1 Tax=Georgenia ruanii TaxID=348442 RepID=A0A7J9UZB8_9MICO|nr:mannitol dehydrogenase family protein [Georgenia ruanii]MPV89989.1 mannitol dehydrogenase family protein [Georgenia ruanii]